MKQKILIVEDQFVEADYFRLMLTKGGYTVTGIARTVTEAQEMIRKDRPHFVLLDILLKGRQTGIDLARQLAEDHLPFVYLSANSNEEILHAAKATQPYGFLVKPVREKDLLVMLEIARYRHEHSIETQQRKEATTQQNIARILASPAGWEQKMLDLTTTLQPGIPFDYLVASPDDATRQRLPWISYLRVGLNEYQKIDATALHNITGKTPGARQRVQNNAALPAFYNADALPAVYETAPLHRLLTGTFNLQSLFTIPVPLAGGRSFTLDLYSRKPDAYHNDHVSLLTRVQDALQKGIDKHLSGAVASAPKPPAAVPVPAEAKGFEGIVGHSAAMLGVVDHVSQVAPTDTSVILLGESGTGKEKIADCIHALSPRKGKPFIKVNCAALPANLIESELFGHEKGAFTGASEKRTGKFEKADKGTIFLDEIGEMPLELQAKLLRVLQEKEIERVGGTDTIRIDVRIIAATNKNLEKEVAEGRFRLDLYYRLNVFPVTLPPLRQRYEDIPVLARHFIAQYNRKTGKKITGLSEHALKKMLAYHWPGNIRELEHLVERHVLLAKGMVIEDVALPNPHETSAPGGMEPLRMKTIQENERDYIIAVLRKCNGRVWGQGAAAEILNLPPSTLKTRMKKLGIRKEYKE